MRTHIVGEEAEGLAVGKARVGMFDRASGGEIDMIRPGDVVGEFLGRDQLSGCAIDYIEEAVFWCMHDHGAKLAADRQIAELDIHRVIIVPGLSGVDLIVPDILAGIGVDCDDRSQEEIVAAAGAADLLVPGRAVSGAEIEAVEAWVIGHRAPDIAAATPFPPFAGPGLRGHFLRIVLETLRGVARYGIETPDLLAGLLVIGGDIAAHWAGVRSAMTDRDLAAKYPGRTGDGAGIVALEGLCAPQQLAGLRVDRHQPAVDRGDKQAAIVIGHAAAAPAGAQLRPGNPPGQRIISPQQFATVRIESVNHSMPERHIKDTFHCDRSTEHVDRRGKVIRPSKAKPLDVRLIDLIERAVMIFVRPGIAGPVRTGGNRQNGPGCQAKECDEQ